MSRGWLDRGSWTRLAWCLVRSGAAGRARGTHSQCHCHMFSFDEAHNIHCLLTLSQTRTHVQSRSSRSSNEREPPRVRPLALRLHLSHRATCRRLSLSPMRHRPAPIPLPHRRAPHDPRRTPPQSRVLSRFSHPKNLTRALALLAQIIFRLFITLRPTRSSPASQVRWARSQGRAVCNG